MASVLSIVEKVPPRRYITLLGLFESLMLVFYEREFVKNNLPSEWRIIGCYTRICFPEKSQEGSCIDDLLAELLNSPEMIEEFVSYLNTQPAYQLPMSLERFRPCVEIIKVRKVGELEELKQFFQVPGIANIINNY